MYTKDINYFIRQFKNIEKLNKTNHKYISYAKDLRKYIFDGNVDSSKEIINLLSYKSSCIPFILSKVYSNEKKEITLIIERLNFTLMTKNYPYETVVNYLVNILSNTKTKNQFINTLKNKDLFNDTVFRLLLNEEFKIYSKFEVNNKNILENIFYKIFDKERHVEIFINSLKLNKYDIYESTNKFLREKDIFHKNLAFILIEFFSIKLGFNIKTINKDPKSYNIFKIIFELIQYNYNDLLEEMRLISSDIVLEKNTSITRICNIKSIVNDPTYINYNKSFFETSLLWLSNVKHKSSDTENLLKIIYYYYTYNTGNIIISKNIYNLLSNILDYNMTNNYHIMIDYYFLFNKILTREENKKFSKHYFYISKVVCKIFRNFGRIYEKIKGDNYLLFDLVLEISCILNLTLLKFNNYRRLFFENIQKNNKQEFYFKKFCCVYLENMIYNIDNLKDNLLDNINIDNQRKYYIKYYYNSLKILFETMKNLTKFYKNIIFCSELQELYNQVLDHFISNIKIIDSEVIRGIDMQININNMYLCIKEIVLNINDIDLLCGVDFSDLKIKLLEENNISIPQIVFFNTKKIIVDKNIVYDDYFCDPITTKLIKYPIMIPDNIIVDRDMIYRYLLTNNENPFNRLELNMKILNEYNNRPNIINKIKDFKSKLNDYKVKINS